MKPPEINPLLERSAAETCAAVAAALSWIAAADPDRLTDLAQRDGLAYVMAPAIAALDSRPANENAPPAAGWRGVVGHLAMQSYDPCRPPERCERPED